MWQVKGQPRTIALLQRSLERGALAHAYLLAGPPHTGKMTLALALAQGVNCEGQEPPCHRCLPCQRIAVGKHADIWTVALLSAGKMEIGIDQVREIREAAWLPPFEGKRKVFIIDGAEHLSAEAANCLLKILEEPPQEVLFLLLTSAETRLLPTILSRCQRVEVYPLPLPEVEQVLGEKGLAPAKAKLLAHLSGGCLGWALQAAQEERILRERREKLSALVTLASASREEVLSFAAELAAEFGKNRGAVYEVLALWQGWWRDLLLIKAGCAERVTNIDCGEELSRQAQWYSLEEIVRFIHSLEAVREQLEQNASPRLALEVLVLSLPPVSRAENGPLR